MSVLVEAISVVVRRTTLQEKYPGGFAAYRADCPNQTFCADAYLARVGFMDPSDVQQFVGHLQMRGLEFLVDGAVADIAVLDQLRGPTMSCEWLRFARNADGTALCWLNGEEPGDLAAPTGWESNGVQFCDPAQDKRIARGGHDGLDVFEDPASEKQFFLGRVGKRDGVGENRDPVSAAREKAAAVDGRWVEGDRLDGRWPIYKIMKGGMGIVYVVQDAKRSELVVAKTFQDAVFQGAGGPRIVERFNIEAKTWVSLGKHPNIVHAFAVRSLGGKPYIFMEYVDGASLSDVIRSGKLRHDRPRVLKLAQDFARGMEYACSHGLRAHRDVKPDNCLISKDGTLKITDFGLAKVIPGADSDGVASRHHHDRKGFLGRWSARLRDWRAPTRRDPGDVSPAPGITQAGTAAGSPTHMAPEQFLDTRNVDVRADIYSFGVMLYEMLRGRLPFDGQSLEALARQHMSERPAPLLNVPDSLWSGIAKCLAKDPRERFSSFGEVSAWLDSEIGANSDELTQAPQQERVPHHEARDKAYTAANLSLYPEALRWCRMAIEEDPNDFEAWSLLGRILGALGRGREAIEAHERATSLNSESDEVWHAMGVTMNAVGRNRDALRCYDQALRVYDGRAQTWYDKGVAHRELNELSEAGECWDRCIKLDSGHAMAWCNRGGIHDDAGDADAAIACYRRALELDAGDGIAWFNLGMIQDKQGHSEEAIRCFEAAERLGMPQAAAARRHCIARLR